jgi:type II secretory pathway component GspD/PulD (secretin)
MVAALVASAFPGVLEVLGQQPPGGIKPGQPGGRSLGRPDPTRAAGVPSTPVDFEIIRLKYITATETAKLLQGLLPETFDPERNSSSRLVADERTNSLIIRAPAAKFAEVAQLLKKIDVAGAEGGPEPAPTRLSFIELHSLVPDEAVQRALQTVIATGGGLYSVDPARKMVIVNANPVTTEAVRELLARLEDAGKSRSQEDAQIRLTWLVNLTPQVADAEADDEAVSREKGPALPDFLKEVVPGLAKLGLEKPRVAAQLVVNAQAKARFQVKGTAMLPNASVYGISASGQLNDLTSAGLEISMGVTAADGKQSVCTLQTQISAPSGHLVVLGMTPIQGMSSAFVVQVIRKDAKERK